VTNVVHLTSIYVLLDIRLLIPKIIDKKRI
jgi:hypothetical protein